MHALRELAVVGFALEQAADASVSFHYAGEPAEKSVQQPLEELFGGAVKVSKALVWEGKPHRFSSALAAPPE